MLELVRNISQTFFEKLSVPLLSLEVEQEGPNIFKVHIKSDDSHMLIGPHGKNLETLSYILKLLLSKQTESHIMIHLEINDYREKKDAELLSFVQSKIDLVRSTGKEAVLPTLSSYERKKIHAYINEKNTDIYAESQGEGEERRMYIYKKDIHLTIDIDGDDI